MRIMFVKIVKIWNITQDAVRSFKNTDKLDIIGNEEGKPRISFKIVLSKRIRCLIKDKHSNGGNINEPIERHSLHNLKEDHNKIQNLVEALEIFAVIVALPNRFDHISHDFII